MKVGDLVKCVAGLLGPNGDGGFGIIVQVEDYTDQFDPAPISDYRNPFDPPGLSVRVQWPHEDLWYHAKDLEIVNESR